mgnify:FL=1|jgi:serine/threonine protein kinase
MAIVSIATACSSTFRYAATDELGRVLGPPADIYSLGVILFELLSGK